MASSSGTVWSMLCYRGLLVGMYLISIRVINTTEASGAQPVSKKNKYRKDKREFRRVITRLRHVRLGLHCESLNTQQGS